MRLKDGVVLALSENMASVLVDMDEIVEMVTGKEMVVTSAREGVHKVGSKHYSGNAVDIRTRELDSAMKERLAKALRAGLGFMYDVVVESTHIHVEYDV